MTSMLTLINNSLKDFRSTYKKYLSFQLMYMLITSFMFVPILSYIFNWILKTMGSNFLLNSEVYKIGLSYAGLSGMIVICFLSVIILFIQFGVIICISQKKYFGKEILITDAFITTMRKTPKLFGFGLLQLMLFLFFLVPFVDSPLTSTFLESINIPIFITSWVYGSSTIFLIVYGLLLLLSIYLILRWIFTLHFIIIDGKSIKEAILCSFVFTKYKKTNILFNLLLFNMIIFIIGFSVISILTYIPSFIGTNIISDLIEHYLVTFSSFMAIVFGLLLIPVNIIFLTRLYYECKKDHSLELEDELFITQKMRGLNQLEKKTFGFFHNRKYLLFSLLTVYMTGIFFLNYAVNENIVYLRWNVEIAGHRGDMHSAPENSLSSIRSAIEKEVDAVEIDVQMTKDGVIVLNHDLTLSRVAGVPERIIDLTYEEISELEIGSHFSEEFRGEKIPTLDEALEEVKKSGLKLIVEIKPYGPEDDLAEKVVALIEAQGMEEECYIQSFNYGILQEVRKLNSNIKIGQILYLAAGNLSSLDVDFYTINQNMLSKKFIRNARRNEREVWTWTVNIERNMKEVLKYDIHGIITDYPEKVQRIIGVDL